MDKLNSAEKRDGNRAKIQIWAEEKRGNSIYYHLLTNLSRKGLFIEKKLPFPIGSTIKLELKLPGSDEKIEIRGDIVGNYQDTSSNNMGAGLEFVDMKPEILDTITKFLEKYEV